MTINRPVIKIYKISEVFIRIDADKGILRELYDHFAFFTKGYKFNPLYKNTDWDGKIRLFNLSNQILYTGLLQELIKFADRRRYDLDYNYSDFSETEFSKNEAIDFINEIIKEVKISYFDEEIREYQLESFIKMVRNNRLLLLSPTSSGKSFMIYLIHRWYNLRTLLITDSTSAVHQMAKDFMSYGYDSKKIHKIYAGQAKDRLNNVVITTWQSVPSLSDEYLNSFDVIIGDEAHHFQSKTFRAFMERIFNAKYRFGFTGTVDKETKVDEMLLVGLFGPLTKIVSTAELIEQGYVSDIKIKSIILQYSDETKRSLLGANNTKFNYDKEVEFLENNSKRNNFIKNLACSQEGNTLVFFRHKDHGEELYRLIVEEQKKRNKGKAFIAHGEYDGEERLQIADEIENTPSGVVAVVSVGTFKTAISIHNVHNMIFALPSKSIYEILQSIGRGLRLHETKKYVTLFDISDNLIIFGITNVTIRHFKTRMKIYSNEKFKVKIYNVNLEKNN